ncbi:MAG: divalent-cation tolerance protein CutA [bacterium]
MEDIRVVFISVPCEEANNLAKGMLNERLAACVNIVPKIESWYWWDDKIEHDNEAMLIVKTTQQRFDALREWVVVNHPYGLPEIIALPISEGLPQYLAWVKKETEG